MDSKKKQAHNAVELMNLKTLQTELERELEQMTSDRNTAIGEKFMLQSQLAGEGGEGAMLQAQQEELENQLAGIKVARAHLMEEKETLEDDLKEVDRLTKERDLDISRLSKETEKARKELDGLLKQTGVKLPEPSKRPSIVRLPQGAPASSRGASFQSLSKNGSIHGPTVSRSLNNSTESRASVKFE